MPSIAMQPVQRVPQKLPKLACHGAQVNKPY